MMQVTTFVDLVLKDKGDKDVCLPGPLLLSSLIFDESNQKPGSFSILWTATADCQGNGKDGYYIRPYAFYALSRKSRLTGGDRWTPGAREGFGGSHLLLEDIIAATKSGLTKLYISPRLPHYTVIP